MNKLEGFLGSINLCCIVYPGVFSNVFYFFLLFFFCLGGLKIEKIVFFLSLSLSFSSSNRVVCVFR